MAPGPWALRSCARGLAGGLQPAAGCRAAHGGLRALAHHPRIARHGSVSLGARWRCRRAADCNDARQPAALVRRRRLLAQGADGAFVRFRRRAADDRGRGREFSSRTTEGQSRAAFLLLRAPRGSAHAVGAARRVSGQEQRWMVWRLRAPSRCWRREDPPSARSKRQSEEHARDRELRQWLALAREGREDLWPSRQSALARHEGRRVGRWPPRAAARALARRDRGWRGDGRAGQPGGPVCDVCGERR
jgi:hypothetical protein